jgi:beta-glucanase (GH16 family)
MRLSAAVAACLLVVGAASAAPPDRAGRIGNLENAQRIDTSAKGGGSESSTAIGWNGTVTVERTEAGTNVLSWEESGLPRLFGYDKYYRSDAPTAGSNDGRIATGGSALTYTDIDGASRCKAEYYWVIAYDRGRKNYAGPIQGIEGDLCGSGSGGGGGGGGGGEPPVQAAVTVTDVPNPFPTCVAQTRLVRDGNGAPAGYTPDLTEDFRQWPIDTSRWYSDYDWGADVIINNELQYYVDAFDADSTLSWTPFLAGLTSVGVQEYAVIRPAITADTAVSLSDVGGQSYLSGILRSRQAFAPPAAGGGWYFEARLAPASGTGLWSAFWTYTSQYTLDAEIDGLEYLGQNVGVDDRNLPYNTYDTAYNAVHRKTKPGRRGKLLDDLEWNNSSESETPEWCGSRRDLSQEFHVYGFEWTPEAITFHVDDIEVWKVTDPALISDESMYLLFNVALGGAWPGNPTLLTRQRIRDNEVQMAIDWVKIYRR